MDRVAPFFLTHSAIEVNSLVPALRTGLVRHFTVRLCFCILYRPTRLLLLLIFDRSLHFLTSQEKDNVVLETGLLNCGYIFYPALLGTDVE